MCVCQDGKINKKLSRRFRIKTVFSQDDPRCLYEVVKRRIKHSKENEGEAFGKLPDVIFADGGINQINAIKKAIREENVNIEVFGMVKDEHHRTKKLINDQMKQIDLTDEEMNFITNMQDEVHKIAIEYNRYLRNKETSKSELDGIKGIGEIRKQQLLKKLMNLIWIPLSKE